MGKTTLLDLLALMEPPKPEGIVFGGYKFSQPVPFRFWCAPKMAGVYAILKYDLFSGALGFLQPYQPVYFGETENFASRVTRSHEHYDDWARAVGSEDDIWVAFHVTVPWQRDERLAIEDVLVKAYKPVCNDSMKFWRVLASFR